MAGSPVFIRGLDVQLMEKVRQHCIKNYGTFYGRQGEVINEALAEFFSNKRHQTTLLTITPGELRADIRARIDKIREELVLFLDQDGNETGQIPISVLIEITGKVVGDQRTVNKYIREYLPRLRFVEPLGTKLIQITPTWISTIRKVEVQQ